MGGLSPAAASYAAAAIAASSVPFSSSRHNNDRRPTNATPKTPTSPFYDPTRPSSPAWGFGEAPGSRPGSRGDSRGEGVGGSRDGDRHKRGASGGHGEFGSCFETGDGDDSNQAEESELLDYTSLGPQIESHRASSPAHAFSRDGLGSESLSMFQVDKKPEPGPGSFRPNLSATSTHPHTRCGVVIGRAGSQGGNPEGEGEREKGVGASDGGGDGRGTGVRPGPGHYTSWDSIGRQILSTRPSSPTVIFATGEWELR